MATNSLGDLANSLTNRLKGDVEGSRQSPSNLPTRSPPKGDDLPPLCIPELEIDLPRRIFSSWTPSGGQRAIVRPLTSLERAKLDARAADLRWAIFPGAGDGDRARMAIAGLLSGFRSMRQDEGDSLALIEVTLAVIGCFPAWAIEKCCVKMARQCRPFAPNDGEIYAEVEAIIRPYKQNLERANALLLAPIAEREKVPTQSVTREPTKVFLTKPWEWDNKHAARVAADLENRKARRILAGAEAQPEVKSSCDSS